MKLAFLLSGHARRPVVLTALLALAAALAGCEAESPAVEVEAPAAGESLVLYSSLPHARTLAIAEAYREARGVTVNFLIEAAPDLVGTMAAKRHQPPADVLLVEGTGVLATAMDLDVLRPVRLQLPADIDPLTPSDPDGYWYGLGYSADAIALAKQTSLPAAPTYAGLAEAEFAGRLCMRRGHSDRNRALVAALLVTAGPREVELTVRGWRRNSLAVPVEGPESIAAALREGRCEAAIIGADRALTLGLLSPGSPVNVYLPTAEAGGAVLHAIAGGVSRHAGNPEAAAAFLEWLLEAPGQRVLHRDGGAFPASESIAAPEPLLPFTDGLSAHSSPASAAFRYDDAVLLIERAGYRRAGD